LLDGVLQDLPVEGGGATIRLSREFSSSSLRNRFISYGSKPPYFLFQLN